MGGGVSHCRHRKGREEEERGVVVASHIITSGPRPDQPFPGLDIRNVDLFTSATSSVGFSIEATRSSTAATSRRRRRGRTRTGTVGQIDPLPPGKAQDCSAETATKPTRTPLLEISRALGHRRDCWVEGLQVRQARKVVSRPTRAHPRPSRAHTLFHFLPVLPRRTSTLEPISSLSQQKPSSTSTEDTTAMRSETSKVSLFPPSFLLFFLTIPRFLILSGNESFAVVEYAIYQKVPVDRKKEDPKQGTIDDGQFSVCLAGAQLTSPSSLVGRTIGLS